MATIENVMIGEDIRNDQESMRLAALKLAYDVSFRIEDLRRSQTLEDRFEALKSTFELADYNLEYIKAGTSPFKEQKSRD